MRKCRGVTVIELLVTLTVMAILAAVAVPSFVDFVRQNRVSGAANEFVAALGLARSEAIRRAGTVTLCKSSDQAQCTTAGDWSQFVLVFVDGGVQGTLDGGDAIVRVLASQGNGVAIDSAEFSNWISYTPLGFSRGNGGATSGTFTACGAPYARSVTINNTGRVSIAQTTC